jgi:6-phosphogluconolactonase
MSTQHPDNVAIPPFATGALMGPDDEIVEAYRAFAILGCDEQLWDYDHGKRTDGFVVERLLAEYGAFFQDAPLGHDVALTIRVPNPSLERSDAKLLLEVLHSLPRHADAARVFYGRERVPVDELILPMTTSAAEIARVRGCYERLARAPYRDGVRWDRVFVYWSDERQVPLDDPASNYGMASRALLTHVPIPSNQVFPLVATPGPGLERVPRDGEGRPRFDIIHLGLGEDGHTASLFPGDPALGDSKAFVRAVRAVKPPPERLTLTFPVLNAARALLFMVQGAGKRVALSGVLRRDPALPAGQVQPVDGELCFIVDEAAFPA